MSQHTGSESEATSPASSAQSNKQSSRRKSSKATKPRLTATQKNTNHKDAENKRRNAIRERFTDLSRMVPGAEGQERSEQVMLGKTADYLKEILEEQRRLEAIAEQRGIVLDAKDKLRDDDFGGPKWRSVNIDAYNATKVKKLAAEGGSIDQQGDDV